MALKLGCKSVELPVTFLGVALGAKTRKTSTCTPVLNKVQKKLGTWKSKVLSRVGRVGSN